MKTMYVLLALLLSPLANNAGAQSPFGEIQEGVMDIKAGPMATAGAALNAGEVSTGSKTSPGFAYTPGGMIDFTYTHHLGFDLGVVYDVRQVNFHDQANSASGLDYTFRYISFRPEFRFSGFLLGVGLGMPVGVGTSASGGASSPTVRLGDVNALFEGRIGGMVELVKGDAGTLDFLIEGSYAFSRNLTDTWLHGADDTKNNGPMATAQAGLCYLFDVMPSSPPAAVTIVMPEGP